jgi:hypothetical protein
LILGQSAESPQNGRKRSTTVNNRRRQSGRSERVFWVSPQNRGPRDTFRFNV